MLNIFVYDIMKIEKVKLNKMAETLEFSLLCFFFVVDLSLASQISLTLTLTSQV